jgi:tRNA(adenine34) deaminase
MDHAKYLDLALEEAELAQKEGSVPVGTIIVSSDGSIVGRGRNRVYSSGDQTAHSETDAIRNSGAVVAPEASRAGLVLYTSAEPCLMCLGAILVTCINTVIWAAGSVAGSAHDAVLASGHESERIRGLQIVREPSPSHRIRSRAMLREFLIMRGESRLAELYAD